MHTPEEVTLKALEQAKSVNADCYVSLPSPHQHTRWLEVTAIRHERRHPEITLALATHD